jgi:hypothetical protein
MKSIDLNILSNVDSQQPRELVFDILAAGTAISGVEKAVQYFVTSLLTEQGTAFDPVFGSTFITSLYRGNMRTNQDVFAAFQHAASDILSNWQSHETDDLNEQLIGAELTDIVMDDLSGRLTITVLLTTAAGTARTVELPLTAVAIV